MNPRLPVVDDTVVWDAWLSLYQVPAISVALDLDIFEDLLQSPASAETLAQRSGFNLRALTALLPMLKSLGFLVQHNTVFQLNEAGRQYMIKSSPFYWGGFFQRVSAELSPCALLLDAVRGYREDPTVQRAVDGWENGHVEMEMAREVTAFMHSHSCAAAIGMTQVFDFTEVRNFLDVGGGSGCFSIALANHLPGIHCSVMELPTICELAEDYIGDAGVTNQVDTRVVDMFRQDWPTDYDTHFFSNIFHDWNFETCAKLASASFKALPSGGRIILHEMLLDDNASGPHPAVAFSLLMAIGTMGQQFTFLQLQELLSTAGFVSVDCTPAYGYYSLISGLKL